ncbi:ATP-binding protein [Campylobacter fetus subsp. testudinum]|uniref:tRNA (adenosine(37)-N6)-threonylcarbamoyltransferase complex ATPase subunit type 1 TsaE n=1 Tax=Campylobacter fetus TaxID=196 RepID=UPI000818C262|nr:tRNA (adenosine(37)-N6)-threonylcarbamoyltransferase complex ATPase subunit type 1 TsaE [Campylobacter fetus]OCR89828.1 ATP-binding protein [Campylobacter fetus subsp. testudinum]OCR98632.1 ATP-binding protein [Campylobacter fetus subsp. testudinum]
MLKKFELGEDELDLIVKELPKSGVIVLQGDLASGKTTLVKSIVKSAGIDENVSSPTFSVMQNYGNIYHYDIYQNGIESIKKNGLFENFFEDGLHIVEWGDENLIDMLNKYEIKVCVVKISVLNDKRTYEVNFA